MPVAQFLVALVPPVSTRGVGALRAALAPLGGTVLNYVPDHTLLVAAPRAAVGAMRGLPGLTLKSSSQGFYVYLGTLKLCGAP